MGNSGFAVDGSHNDGSAAAATEAPPPTGAAARTRITHHAYLVTHPYENDALGYLTSLLTVAVSHTADPARGVAYLRTLATSFAVTGFDEHAASPEAVSGSEITPELLQRVGAGWSWLADATFVLCLGSQPDAVASQRICAIACQAGLPQGAVEKFAALIAGLAVESDATRALADVCAASEVGGDAWKAIVDYRGLSFHEAVRDLRTALASIRTIQEAVHLSLDMTAERWKVLDCMSGIPDEGLAVRIAVAANRQVRLSKFAAFKRKVEDFVARDAEMLAQARRLARTFGVQKDPHERSRSAAVADRNVGYGNEAWGDHMHQAYDGLQALLDDHDQASFDALDQIAEIADGRW